MAKINDKTNMNQAASIKNKKKRISPEKASMIILFGIIGILFVTTVYLFIKSGTRW